MLQKVLKVSIEPFFFSPIMQGVSVCVFGGMGRERGGGFSPAVSHVGFI